MVIKSFPIDKIIPALYPPTNLTKSCFLKSKNDAFSYFDSKHSSSVLTRHFTS